MQPYPGTDLHVSVKPTRRVIHRGSVRTNGLFISRKMRRSIPWESSHERVFLWRAELDPEVTAVYAQPMRLTLDDGRIHYPDFAVTVGERLEIHEVKEDVEAAQPEVEDFLQAARRHVEKRGAPYILALQSFLEAQPILRNMEDVLRRLHSKVAPQIRFAVLTAARRRSPMTIRELAAISAPWGGLPHLVIAMIAHGDLRADLTKPINDDALVWEPGAFPFSSRLLPLPAAYEPAR